MADRPKYHLREQQANALLGPVRASLRELEGRVQHYLDWLALAPADQDALQAAHRALATAYQELDRVWRESERLPRA